MKPPKPDVPRGTPASNPNVLKIGPEAMFEMAVRPVALLLGCTAELSSASPGIRKTNLVAIGYKHLMPDGTDAATIRHHFIMADLHSCSYIQGKVEEICRSLRGLPPRVT